MKLFYSTSVQKKLGCKCEKVPLPENPLDCWYAHLITVRGADTLVAMLPEYRFCVLIWKINENQWANLNQVLVQAIRTALDHPLYGIPMAVIDQYIPEDTVFAPCATNDRGVIAKMSAVTKKILESGQPSFWDLQTGEKFDPVEAQLEANDYMFLTKEHPRGIRPWQALRDQLRLTYGKTVPSMELEVSLDLGKHIARRNLIVSVDTPFLFLHHYLQAAYRWRGNGTHRFDLPPAPDRGPGRNTLIRVLDSRLPDEEIPQDAPYFTDREVRLGDLLQEGDSFLYRYDPEEADTPCKLPIRVIRSIPAYDGNPPVCTLCEGKSSPDWVNGAAGYQKFCKIVRSPKHPRHDEMVKEGEPWLQEDSVSDINQRIPRKMNWLQQMDLL